MRIRIYLEDDSIINKDLNGFSKDIEFPCRLIAGDMLAADIFADDLYKSIVKDWDQIDHPEVECTRFNRDEQGIFQEVWLDVHKLD